MGKKRASQIISRLNRINFDRADYEVVKGLVADLLGVAPLALRQAHYQYPVFRAVVHRTKPELVSFLGYPPPHLVTGYGRCNQPGKPVFYGSLDPATPFAEVRPRPGDLVYRSKWSVIEEITAFNTASYEMMDDPSHGFTNDSSKVMSYIDTVFSAPVHETFSNQFKVTAALMDLLRGPVVNRDGAELGVLLYPSVADPDQQGNIAILPQIADKVLRLDYVEEIEVLDPNTVPPPPPELGEHDGFLALRARDFSSSFADGEIRWQGRPKVLPSPQGGIEIEPHRGTELHAWDGSGRFIDPV